MKYCSACGYAAADDAIFCGNCRSQNFYGASVESVSEAPSSESTTGTFAGGAAAENAAQEFPSVQDDNGPAAESRSVRSAEAKQKAAGGALSFGILGTALSPAFVVGLPLAILALVFGFKGAVKGRRCSKGAIVLGVIGLLLSLTSTAIVLYVNYARL